MCWKNCIAIKIQGSFDKGNGSFGHGAIAHSYSQRLML